MNDARGAAREVLTGVKERYPAPIAAVAAELLYEFSAARPNSMRCFLLEIDLFEVSVAFFGLLQVAQLHKAETPLKSSEAAVLQLRDNPALCTGHWWGLLRETSRDVHALPAESVSGVARELAGLYFDPAGKAARLGKVLDQVPGLRNRVKGHAWTLPDEQYEAHAGELLGTAVSYLSCLDFLERYVLFQCLACEPGDDGHVLDVALLVGDARRPGRQRGGSAEPLAPGRLYLARKDDLAAGRLDRGAALGLHPFVQVRARDGRPEALYLLQALRDGAAELRSAVGGDALVCPASGREARALLDGLVGRSASAGSPFARLREAVAAASREALASPLGRASYRAEAYYVRPRLLRQVDEFVASGQGVALLAAPSGMGKTALACHLADRWLLSANETEAVLVLFAHDLAGADESLDGGARRRLGFPLTELRDAAARAGARVLVVVDGLERARDRRALLDEAAALRAAGGDALRFLCTVTESALADLTRAGPGPTPAAPQLIVIPPLDAGEGKRLYEIFQGPGGNGAPRPPDELLASLGTPLLIRLAQASARAGEDVSAAQVLLAYTEQVIFSDLARAELVNRLADRILDTGARTVPVAELARDDWVRSALLSDAPDAALRGLVRDGVLFVEWVSPGGRLPVPAEPHVGFPFDPLRDFLVFARLCRRAGTDLSAVVGAASGAGPSSAVVGGLRFLVLESLRQAPPGAPPQETLDLLHRLEGPSRQALLRELFLVPCSAPLVSARADLLRALFVRLDPAEQRGFLEAARGAFDHLEPKGLVDEAGALCALAAELGLAPHPGQVLPLVCAWSRLQLRNVGTAAAEETARFALAAAEALTDPSFRAEALACLADALYTSGRRREAAELLRPAITGAAEARSDPTEFAVALSAAWILHEFDRPAAREALARVRRLAEASARPRWLAQACFAELGTMLGSPQMAGTPRAAQLVEEWLGHARQAGYPALEADACSLAAWCWQQDPARELTYIEAGLEAADAGRDLAGRAELLACQARWLLRVGRPAEAEGPAREAAALLERLGYRPRALRLRQHALVVIEWELGRPGKALTLLRGNLDGFRAMGMAGEAALSALLCAELTCDAGGAADARALLADAHKLAVEGGWDQRLNYNLVLGKVLQLEGDSDRARAAYARARQWGVDNRHPDFVYQPGILAARLLLERQDDAKGNLDRADALLQELLEDRTMDRKYRERYEGEMCALYARLHVERGNPEQAEVWLGKAEEWFARHPAHRGVPEWRATRLALDWMTANQLEQAAQGESAEKAPKGKERDERARALKRAQGIKKRVRERVGPDVLQAVRVTAGTFDDPQEAAGYDAGHPVHRLLERQGIGPG